ncbi:NAD dependent epimerase/dehydratase family protein, partial [Candidatus Electrothrix communis]
MDKIAIVIGATGLVGRALVNQLANADHIGKVITLTRRSAQ